MPRSTAARSPSGAPVALVPHRPYAVAFVLSALSSTLFVFVVALVRTGGHRSHLQAAAYDFALSAPGLMGGALVNAAILDAAAFAAARLYGASVGAALRLGPSRATPLGLIAATVGVVGINFAFGTASELLRLRGTGVMVALAQSLRGPSVGLFVVAVLAIGVAPGSRKRPSFAAFSRRGWPEAGGVAGNRRHGRCVRSHPPRPGPGLARLRRRRLSRLGH